MNKQLLIQFCDGEVENLDHLFEEERDECLHDLSPLIRRHCGIDEDERRGSGMKRAFTKVWNGIVGVYDAIDYVGESVASFLDLDGAKHTDIIFEHGKDCGNLQML
ncbi:MAG: hypothetical protein MHMPM18_000851 [Marteilia pararefringens]